MRKLLFILIVLILVACDESEPIIDLSAPLEGVEINGVRWATRNVAMPGTFAANPEDTGMFFQWNRRMGWSYHGSLINSSGETNWTNSNQSGADWDPRNDPCPEGWRVPTQEEIQSLRDAGSRWRSLNGVNGRLFGTLSNGIFLPAAGWLNNGYTASRGKLFDDNSLGMYWTRTISGNNQARNMTFSDRIAGGMRSNARADGYSIRCVKAYVTDIVLNRDELIMSVGGTETLVATVSPQTAIRAVTWSVGDPAIASVDDSGVVTAISLGTTTIRATSVEGSKYATSTVNVIQLDSSLDGVVIDGNRWATRNVAAPGTFANAPQDAGMFYQWNRRVGWYYTDHLHNTNGGTTWDNTAPTGAEWASINNPCPPGWRIPSADELDALRQSGHVWITYNGIRGRLFGVAPNRIFLPAAGWLNNANDGARVDANIFGNYWSSILYEAGQARSLHFSNNVIETRNNATRDGLSIRCIASN